MMAGLADLFEWFDSGDSVMVALSGGVDSALVAFAAHKKLGNDAVAVTADYKTLSHDELDSAKSICDEIGIRHILIDYDELENEKFVQNNPDRCFHCRTELAANLLDLAKKHGIRTIVDGTNLSDLGEYRPGIEALHSSNIKSPLAETGFTKDDVRREAQLVGLSVYDRPSNSCLASRIPWGRRVTAERLVRIELGETIVKNLTSVRQVRVRDMDGTARIEVGAQDVKKIHDNDIIDKLDSQLRIIGFKSVEIDPEGYRPGKINVMTD